MAYTQEHSEWDSLLAEESASMYDLEHRLLDFSVRAIRLTRKIESSQAGTHIAKQLLRSATAPLANHGEAQAAESPRDFIHKLRISLKELRETERWIKLTKAVPLVDKPERLNELLDETDQLIRIFVTSIKTAESRASSR
ncbi:four helix bundle protein [Coraliomargarita algicola]|uniref:Four helix bundle protein n=2 Tax=Coraliomargaritaceae TaxID=3056371 RepID=A0ABU1ARI1_9BACT|nr:MULTISPECIES: four helix bundle protein [unclassified Coraliomargarita]MDQ8206768.1 four helix bundle protein [Coraliomargarita sp. SDUM461003]WPJ96350.1 four helix bundle protein [Coraliomargarita sp. J2-16]